MWYVPPHILLNPYKNLDMYIPTWFSFYRWENSFTNVDTLIFLIARNFVAYRRDRHRKYKLNYIYSFTRFHIKILRINYCLKEMVQHSVAPLQSSDILFFHPSWWDLTYSVYYSLELGSARCQYNLERDRERETESNRSRERDHHSTMVISE